MTDRMEVVLESVGRNGNAKLFVRRGERTLDADEANLASADDRQRAAERLAEKFPVLDRGQLVRQFEQYACQTADRQAKQLGRFDESEAPAFEEPDLGQPNFTAPREPGRPPIAYQRISAAELDDATYRLEFLIEGTMTAGQPLIVAGGKKTLKTNILIDAAISLATGNPFLGELPVSRSVRVAVMSGESGMHTIQETARRICRAKGIELRNVTGLIFSPDLPRIDDARHHVALEEFIRGDEIEALILDPAYLMMPGGDAGNLFVQGEMLRSLARLCDQNGVTLAMCHHLKKGVQDPFAPPELEHIAWAGFQEFARQWWLIGRRDRYEPGTGDHRLWLNIGGSAGHSALWAVDVTEGTINQSGGRVWGVSLSTASNARRQAEEHAAGSKRAKEQTRLNDDVRALLEVAERYPDGESKTTIRAGAGLNSTRCNLAIASAIKSGRLTQCEIFKSGKRTPIEGYKPVMRQTQRDQPD